MRVWLEMLGERHHGLEAGADAVEDEQRALGIGRAHKRHAQTLPRDVQRADVSRRQSAEPRHHAAARA